RDGARRGAGPGGPRVPPDPSADPYPLRVEQLELRQFLGLEADPVLAGEARVTELIRVRPGGLQHALEREIAEGVRAQVPLDLVDLVARAGQLAAGPRGGNRAC